MSLPKHGEREKYIMIKNIENNATIVKRGTEYYILDVTNTADGIRFIEESVRTPDNNTHAEVICDICGRSIAGILSTGSENSLNLEKLKVGRLITDTREYTEDEIVMVSALISRAINNGIYLIETPERSDIVRLMKSLQFIDQSGGKYIYSPAIIKHKFNYRYYSGTFTPELIRSREITIFDNALPISIVEVNWDNKNKIMIATAYHHPLYDGSIISEITKEILRDLYRGKAIPEIIAKEIQL